MATDLPPPPPPPPPPLSNGHFGNKPPPCPEHAALPFNPSRERLPVQETSPSSETLPGTEDAPVTPPPPGETVGFPLLEQQEDSPSDCEEGCCPKQETGSPSQVAEEQEGATSDLDQHEEDCPDAL